MNKSFFSVSDYSVQMALTSNTSTEYLLLKNDTVSNDVNSVLLYVYNTYLYLMIILGVLGNLLVLVVFIKHHPSTTTDWFILFITTCDFITSFINVPVYVSLTNGLWEHFGNNIICKVHMFISQSLVLSSAFLICGLALDRYIKVCKPMASFSKAKALIVCLLISLSTCVLSTPCIVLFEDRQGSCRSVEAEPSLVAYYLLVFLTFVFSTGVVVFSYTHVTRKIRNSERTIASHNTMKGSVNRKKTFHCRKLNKVLPNSGCQSENNFINGKSNSSNCRINLEENKTATTEYVNKIFVLRPTQNMCMPGTSNRDTPLNPSLCLDSSTGIFQNSQTLSVEQTNRPTASVSGEQIDRRSQIVSLRTTKIAFLVCTLFILTWIPPWASFILSAIPEMNLNKTAVTFALFGRMTYLINNMTNPILYTWLNRKFRKNIVAIFTCCKPTT